MTELKTKHASIPSPPVRSQQRTRLYPVAMRTGLRSCVLILLLVAGYAASTAQAEEPFPPEVTRFLDRRAMCDHWRGEPADDAARRAEIIRGACRSCLGTDATVARLKKKYATRPDVMAELGKLDAVVEPRSASPAQDPCRKLRK